MATQTQHFNLTKPDWEDRASISVLNANTDIIDAQMYDNEQSAANAIGNMAAEYDDTATYEVGDFCIYSEVLYKCVTAVSVAEAFDSTKWTQTRAAENFGSGGGGGSATLAGLTDVNLTSPTDGQALVYDATNQEWVNGAGGGGNANERVLTKAEYEALTDAEKLNGTTYYINDAVPEGKEIQPVIYSLEEREVGVWTDGKPLYQKTVDCGLIPNDTNWHQIAHNISDLGNAVYMTGIIVKTDGTEEIPVNSYRPSETKGFVITRNGSNIQFLNNWNVANVYRLYVTLQYTKTTDTAGSGVWTTSGVPAVHYSTEEQILGTWIDGSTVYEKMLVFSTPISAATAGQWNPTSVTLSSLSIDKLIDGTAYDETGQVYPAALGKITSETYIGFNLFVANRTIKSLNIRYTKTTD